AGAPVIAYGSFLNAVLDFVILAFVVFCMIRQINKLMPSGSFTSASKFRNILLMSWL
ncbi:MAG: MscL family protein, partial [Oscillospiraceae bacterium]|nr:MscL family protein [Oscillospiraceae bacterium]